MKIILLQDIKKLGRKYETREVSSGYAINLLIPRGLAVPATEAAEKRYGTERKRLEGEQSVRAELMLKNIKDLDGITITVSGKANDKGHLFAGLHREEIAAQIFEQTRLEIDPSFIQIEHPIKELGEHELEVKSAGKSAKFKLNVI